MNTYKSTPNIPENLNDTGREYFRNLSNRLIAKDNLNNYTKYQIGIASFIYMYMKKIERNESDYTTADDLELYMKLSQELRKVENRLFNSSTVKKDLLQ